MGRIIHNYIAIKTRGYSKIVEDKLVTAFLNNLFDIFL